MILALIVRFPSWGGRLLRRLAESDETSPAGSPGAKLAGIDRPSAAVIAAGADLQAGSAIRQSQENDCSYEPSIERPDNCRSTQMCGCRKSPGAEYLMQYETKSSGSPPIHYT